MLKYPLEHSEHMKEPFLWPAAHTNSGRSSGLQAVAACVVMPKRGHGKMDMDGSAEDLLSMRSDG